MYGSTRSEKTAKELAKEEILPIVLDPTSDSGLKTLADLAEDVDVGKPRIPIL